MFWSRCMEWEMSAWMLATIATTTSSFIVTPYAVWKKPTFTTRLLQSESSSSSALVPKETQNDLIRYSQLENIFVQDLEGESIPLPSVIPNDQTVVLSCLSHFGDYNAWEVTQQYIAALGSGRISTPR